MKYERSSAPVNPIRVGVVGAGFMGRSYARILQDHPLVAFAGIADSDPVVAERVGAELNVAAFESTATLLEAGHVDGVFVATIESSHVEPCLAAFAAGAGVLVEKPLATTLIDGQAIIDAALAANKPLLTGHVLRFDARYAALRDAVQSGSIGQPLTAYARRLNGVNAQQRLRGRCSLPLFLGVHDYDMLRWVLDSEVVGVVARERRGHLRGLGYDVEDMSAALLTFRNGVLAIVEEGWVLPDGHPSGSDYRLDVNGATGRADVTGHEHGFTLIANQNFSTPDAQLWPTVNGRLVGALRRQTAHFVDVLRGETPPLVSGEDGLAAMVIALAVEESARSGQEIRLAAGE